MLVTYFLLAYVAGALSLSCAKNPKKCGINEEYAMCKITCPPQFCNNSYTDYGICPENPPCDPGCNCKKDYLRDFDGICVFNEDCPPQFLKIIDTPAPSNGDECQNGPNEK